ncbi:MAG: methyltransferase domain-containing protein [Chloroflexota bacterium]
MNPDVLANILEQEGVLTDENVAQAFRAVPRHVFLPEVDAETVYQNRAIYTATDTLGGYTGGSDHPAQMARMLTIAELEPGHNVLEIGTGTGYNAALLQHIVGDNGNVTTLEINRDTHDRARDHLQRISVGSRINTVNADGAMGYSARSSYDRIISTVALWDVPPAWTRQLRPGGLIVAPVYMDGLQFCAALEVADDDHLTARALHTCSFVEMQGMEAPPPQYIYLGGGSALRIYSNEARKIDSAALHMLLSNDAENCHLGVAPSNYEFWDGFIPYMMLNVPDGYDFVCYTVVGDKNVYGLEGSGFALIAQSSAAFTGADLLGNTNCFAGVDAFLEIDSGYSKWVSAGSPHTDRIRLQLRPKQEPFDHNNGLLLGRRYHNLHIWLETGDNTDGERPPQ